MPIIQLACLAGVFFPLHIWLSGRLLYPGAIAWPMTAILFLISGISLTYVVWDSDLRPCNVAPAVLVCR